MTSDKNETPTGMTEDAPRAAETGGTIQSREVAAGDGAPAASDPKPMIDSALVGQSDDPLPAAAPKDAEPKGDAPFESEEDYHELPRVPKASPFAAEDETAREDEGMAAGRPAPAAMAPVTPAPQVIEKRTGFWPVALGGVVAAALGSAATIWALPHLPAAWLPVQEPAVQEPAPQIDGDAIRADAVSAATDAAREAAREAATETARAEVQAGLEAQADTIRQSAEDAARAVLAELPESGADTPEELQAALTAQNQRIDEMEARIADLAAAPAPQAVAEPVQQAEPAQPAEPAQASAEPAADLSAFEDRIAALQSQLDEQQSRIEELQARPEIDSAQFDELRSMAEQAAETRDRIEAAASEAQQTLESVQADAAAASERAQAVASFAALRAALETGGDRAAASADLADAGVTVPEALSVADLPTLDELQAGFDPAARAALRASLQSGAEAGSNAVTRFLRVQTGARSVTPREGTDPDAVLSRAGAAVQAGQIDAALTEIAALPQPGQDAMAEWTAQARAWVDAQAALDDVASSLN